MERLDTSLLAEKKLKPKKRDETMAAFGMIRGTRADAFNMFDLMQQSQDVKTQEVFQLDRIPTIADNVKV